MALKLRVNRIKAQELFVGDAQTTGVTAISTDGTLAGNSDAKIPTEKAIKTYVGNQATAVSQNLTTTPALTGTGTPVHCIGSIDTARTSTATANFIASQMNISQTADIGTGNTVGASYLRCSTGAAQTGQIAVDMIRTYIGHNIFDAYGVQSHMNITASMATVNDNAHLTAISGKVTLANTPTVSKGWVNAGLFIIEGAGSITQMAHVASFVVEAGVTACQSVVHLYSDSTVNAAIQTSGVSNMTNFVDFDAAAGCVSADTGSVPATSTHKIKIDINGTAGYIPVYADY